MGNYNFKSAIPPPNSVLKIVHDKFSKDEGIPDDLLGVGQPVKVLNTRNIYQSRPNAPPITVSRVQLRSGATEAYLTVNLK